MVVNLGGDSDTNACIYGFLAGAYYGYESFPEAWKQGLVEREKNIDFAEQLYILKQQNKKRSLKSDFFFVGISNILLLLKDSEA